jgi:serine/threonine-protein phosphatase PP1 catalytic subunit
LSNIAQISAAAGASEFLQQLELAISVLKQERERKKIAGGTIIGNLIEVGDYDRLVIIGDLHGDSSTLFWILHRINYERFLSNARNKIFFLGDYVDRGTDSIGVLYAICYLKYTYPHSIILMRGNHEAPAEFPFSSHDLPYELQDRFGASAKTVYGKILDFFELLTLATVVRSRLLLVHGGLPTDLPSDWRIAIATAQERHLQNNVMEQLLWNDPRPLGEEEIWEPSWRGIGRHFGPSVTRRWLAVTDTKAVVRGHEPCHGYRVDHNGKILTLFSCREPYPGLHAAYLVAEKSGLDCVSNADGLIKFVRKVL